LQLDNVKACRPGAENSGEVDIRFDVCFVLVKVGNGDILPGTSDERVTNTILLRDHLVVGAECCRAACLAGIDRVASRDVDAARLVGRVLACCDDGDTFDSVDTSNINNLGVRRREH